MQVERDPRPKVTAFSISIVVGALSFFIFGEMIEGFGFGAFAIGFVLSFIGLTIVIIGDYYLAAWTSNIDPDSISLHELSHLKAGISAWTAAKRKSVWFQALRKARKTEEEDA